MKKFLLPLFAATLFAAPAMADDEVYGTSPETAKPFPIGPMGWFLPSLDDAPEVAWFTFTNEKDVPVMFGGAPSDWSNPGVTLPQQVFAYLCNGGSEALQMVEGSDSYIILPSQEVLVKITPKVSGSFCMGDPMGLPDSQKGKKYYPIDRSSSDFESAAYSGQANKQEPGSTVYYLYSFAYPAQLNLQPGFMSETNIMTDITAIETIHIECPGGTNTGNGLVQPYVKAGKSILGVTASAEVEGEVVFTVGLNAMGALSCGNNLLRGQEMVLDQKETYPDAYYTVDRFFKVPEDGAYTFTNHGAKGTILNVGKVILTDPDNQYKYECDWTDIKSATVGNEDAVISLELKKDEIVIVQSDAFGVIGEGLENQPYLMVTKGTSSVANIAADGNTLKVAASNGVLSVESVLLASGAEVAVYDMNANKVASAQAAAGAANLEVALDVPAGIYVVVIYGKGNSESAKIVVK